MNLSPQNYLKTSRRQFTRNFSQGSFKSLVALFLSALIITGCSDEPSADDKSKAQTKSAANQSDNKVKGDRKNQANAGRKGGKDGLKGPTSFAKAIPVELAKPAIGDAASFYVTTATLEPSSDAQVNARISGVVRKILREEGDDVKAGDILLQLEDDEQKLKLEQAEQKLASSKREFERLSRMKKAGVVSPNEWEAANNTYLTAKTDVELAQLALSFTQVAAPFDGRVVWRDVDLGEHVSAGRLLYRVMAIKPLLLRVHVPANRIGYVAKGQLVELIIDSAKQTLIGTVELVSPIVDPATGTIKVTIELTEYPAQVRPGDFTQVQMITDKRENALLLPSVAIIEERGNHYLYVEQDNKATRKNIEVGFVVGDQTEVISGISADDNVVVKGQRNLNQGNSLQVIEPKKADSVNSSHSNNKNSTQSARADS
jgi:membrane fusion protein, multidrug efflux system